MVVSAEAEASPQGHARWLSAADEVRALPGVESVALAAWPLLIGNRWRSGREGRRRSLRSEPPYFLGVSPASSRRWSCR